MPPGKLKIHNFRNFHIHQGLQNRFSQHQPVFRFCQLANQPRLRACFWQFLQIILTPRYSRSVRQNQSTGRIKQLHYADVVIQCLVIQNLQYASNRTIHIPHLKSLTCQPKSSQKNLSQAIDRYTCLPSINCSVSPLSANPETSVMHKTHSKGLFGCTILQQRER